MRKCAFSFAIVFCALVYGDEVTFKNGDHVTGAIGSIDGGKMKIKSAVAGDITVNMSEVASFKTDAPVTMRMTDNSMRREQVTADVKPEQIKRLNVKQAWTGSVLANGSLARGNTHSMDLGVAADATLRRDDEEHDDRFSLGAGYNFGKQRVAGIDTTSADNWFAQIKYDKFFSEKWYGYALMRYDHDRLAFLDYRLSPGVGIGYQWVERPDFKFNTEAGVSYVYEQYSTDGSDDRVALRLAYHLEKQLNDKVSIFHNLEWLPAFDNPADYNLNADAGIKAKLTESFFSEFKVQYQRDSTPAPGALKNDIRFLLGVGWNF